MFANVFCYINGEGKLNIAFWSFQDVFGLNVLKIFHILLLSGSSL